MARQYGSNEQARRRRNDRIAFVAVCVAVALIITLLHTGTEQWTEILAACNKVCNELTGTNTELSDDRMIIHVIDVSQGDSVLVQCNEANILIDAGESEMGEVVTGYLRSVGVRKLDWVICTHPHSDHYGGIETVLEEMTVENFMMSGFPERFEPDDRDWFALLDGIGREGIAVTTAVPGQCYTFGGMTMAVLWPTSSFNGADANDWSVALRFSFEGIDFLTCGDMTEGAEDDLIDTGFDITAEIVKSNHHGSGYANGSDFLYEVLPDVAIISCGRDNRYGHPHDELLGRYEYYGIRWKRTDVSGSIRVICGNGEYTIETED